MNGTYGLVVLCTGNHSDLAMTLSLRIFGGGSFLMLGVAAFLANGVIIYLFSRHSHLRSASGWIMINMAVSDNLLAVSAIIFATPAASMSCFPFNNTALGVFVVLSLSSFVQSTNGILFVAIDRYFAVCRPLHYVRIVTKNKVFLAEAVSWCFTVIYCGNFIFNEEWEEELVQGIKGKSRLFSIYIIVPWSLLVCTMVCYCFMLRGIRRKRKISCAPTMFGEIPAHRPHLKLAVTMVLVTTLFILSNLPIVIVGSMSALRVSSDMCRNLAVGISGFLFHASSLLNPIVYLATFKPIREAVRKIRRASVVVSDIYRARENVRAPRPDIQTRM